MTQAEDVSTTKLTESTPIKQNGVNGTNENHEAVYSLLDQWFGKKHFVKIIGIGSGASGIALAYKLSRGLTNFQLTLYERDFEMGGTWKENSYPGVACDIPAHIYTYTFEGNPDWSTFYAYGAEIHGYFQRFAEKYKLMDYFKFNREIISARWNDVEGIWNIGLRNPKSGEISHDWCHVFLNSSGRLNVPKLPEIQGIESFHGPIVHSAAWSHDVQYEGKTIAIIGNGASGIQITPQLQKVANRLICFMRSPTWITPPIGSNVASELRQARNDSQLSVVDNPEERQMSFTDDEKQKFREDPQQHLAFRQSLEGTINQRVNGFIMGTNAQEALFKNCRAEMLKRIGPGHDEIKAKLIPTWSPGCRRMTPGDGYLEALTSPNVSVVFSDVARITKNGIVSMDGSEHQVDIIICATGFKLPFQPHFEIYGLDGVTMKEEWSPEPNCYLGIASPKFPNYWVIMGPRGPWGNGSVLPAMETSCDYFVKLITKIQIEGIKSLEPRQDVTDELMEHIDEFHKGSVWSQGCRSWYKRGQIDGRPWLWCGGVASYLAAIKNPRFEDYHITYKNKNRWAYIGNGRIKANYPEQYPDGKVPMSALAPYIRQEDKEWDFDY